MAELESYTGEWTLKVGGAVLEDSKYPLLAGIQSDPDIPTWELHLGFDVPKSAGTGLPLALPTLMRACTEAGLENGGWFIFKNESSWAYRSNEFSSLDETRATEKLFAQARTLAAILAERGIVVDVSFSLERVHGIWT